MIIQSLFLRFLLILYTCLLMSHMAMFNLYKTKKLETSLEYDCLDYYVKNSTVEYDSRRLCAYQVMAYCIRPSCKNERSMTLQRLENQEFIKGQNFTFNQLKNQNITGEQLLAWLATIDLAERYEAYLVDKSEVDGSEVYYNCTASWFGNRCEYTFGILDVYNFDVI